MNQFLKGAASHINFIFWHQLKLNEKIEPNKMYHISDEVIGMPEEWQNFLHGTQIHFIMRNDAEDQFTYYGFDFDYTKLYQITESEMEEHETGKFF